MILSGWVTQGPEVAAFEREFAEYVGAPHACAVSNCTTALHLALLAVGVGAGDEVITVSHSFIATANAIRYCGATPVFVDIEPGTLNMDPALIEPAITERTKAILCVHQLGMPCDLARIVEIGRRRGIPVIEDAACAIGSEILWNGRWEKIGKPHGDIACFSFHPRKVITTGDGGMLTTANPELRSEVPPVAAALDERAGHGAPRRPRGHLRELSGGRLQLPDDRHAGGGRPRAAHAAARRSSRSAGASRASTRRGCRRLTASPLPSSRRGRARTGRATASSCLSGATSGR